MRILVLNDVRDGTADVRERREVFDLAEFRLSYTCPHCGNEFIFKAEKSEPVETWRKCPMCARELATWKDQTNPPVVLWEALSLYRDFYKFVTGCKLPLKLVVTESLQTTSPDDKIEGLQLRNAPLEVAENKDTEK